MYVREEIKRGRIRGQDEEHERLGQKKKKKLKKKKKNIDFLPYTFESIITIAIYRDIYFSPVATQLPESAAAEAHEDPGSCYRKWQLD